MVKTHFEISISPMKPITDIAETWINHDDISASTENTRQN